MAGGGKCCTAAYLHASFVYFVSVSMCMCMYVCMYFVSVSCAYACMYVCMYFVSVSCAHVYVCIL